MQGGFYHAKVHIFDTQTLADAQSHHRTESFDAWRGHVDTINKGLSREGALTEEEMRGESTRLLWLQRFGLRRCRGCHKSSAPCACCEARGVDLPDLALSA